MSSVQWIKLLTTLPDDEKIKTIELMPERFAIFYVWIMLLIHAGKCNAGGYIYLSEKMPYQEDQLANQFRMPPNILKLALAIFQKLNMIEVGDDGLIFIPNFAKHQNIEGLERIRENTRIRVAKFRAAQKHNLLPQQSDVTLRNVTVTHLDKELDIRKEEEKNDIDVTLKNDIDVTLQNNNNWEKITEILKTRVSASNYRTWIKDLHSYCASDEFFICSPRQEVLDYLEKYQRSLIERVVFGVMNCPLKIYFVKDGEVNVNPDSGS